MTGGDECYGDISPTIRKYLVDDGRRRSWRNRPRWTHARDPVGRVSKSAAPLPKKERILSDVRTKGQGPKFSIAIQVFLCIPEHSICPLQKLCSLLDNSHMDQVVRLEIETSHKQSFPIEVAAGEFYCFRIGVKQPKAQSREIVRNDATICRGEITINRCRSTRAKDRLMFNRRLHLNWVARERFLAEQSCTKPGSKHFHEGYCVSRCEKQLKLSTHRIEVRINPAFAANRVLACPEGQESSAATCRNQRNFGRLFACFKGCAFGQTPSTIAKGAESGIAVRFQPTVG